MGTNKKTESKGIDDGALERSGMDMDQAGREAGMSADQRARWAGRATNRAMVDRLVAYGRLRAELLLSWGRAEAARQLTRISLGETAGEPARRACVDLIKLTGEQARRRDAEPAGVDEDALHEEWGAMMERELAEEASALEDGHDAQDARAAANGTLGAHDDRGGS